MKVSKQNIKFFTGRSQFRMKLNHRAADSEADKANWNGLIPTEIPPSSDEFDYDTFDDFTVGARNIKPTPSSLDYRDHGFVTHVKDQGPTCGSCYAFSAACAFEGQIKKIQNRSVVLSEQNVVDCSQAYGNYGCGGGTMEAAMRYAQLNPGMANDTWYPNSGNDDACYYEPSMMAAKIRSYAFVRGSEELVRKALVAVGPLAVGMKGDLDSFYFYAGGIFDDVACVGPLNHAVCLVGECVMGCELWVAEYRG
jgi:cathepsin L